MVATLFTQESIIYGVVAWKIIQIVAKHINFVYTLYIVLTHILFHVHKPHKFCMLADIMIQEMA